MEATTVCAHCGIGCEGRPLICESCGEDPRVQGRYRLEGELGRGGSGVTWRARREPSGEPVCLKELRWASMGNLDDERRFAREGKLLEALDHPAIPRHHGAFAWGEGRRHALFIAQELVVGDNLEVERRARGYTLPEVLAAGAELADVLAYLHERLPPVVHRDIKPSNVMRRADGKLVLIDFGAARVSGLGEPSVSVAGTFGFMAPEQLRGEAGPPADVYGLGMTLAVMCAGGAPEDLLDGANRPDFGRIVGLRADLRSLLERMCAVSPAERPSAAAVAQRCRELLQGPTRAPAAVVRAPPPAPRPVPPEPPARRAGPKVALLLALVIMFIAIGVSTVTLVGTNAPSIVHDQPRPAASASWTSEPSVVTAEPAPLPAPTPAPEPAPDPLAVLAASAEACSVRGEEAACDALAAAAQSQREQVVSLPGWPRALAEGCERGVASACYNTAIVHSQGIGVTGSRLETRKYFGKACERGHLDGCSSYGHMLMKGDGGPTDWKAALPPLEKACAGGNDDTCISVGAIYAGGESGAKADRPKALAIFEGLCGKGVHVACENVDAMVGNNWGLPASGAARIETLARLCAQKSGAACLRLGDAYARGSGVKKDPAKASEAYTRGCDLGLKGACDKMK